MTTPSFGAPLCGQRPRAGTAARPVAWPGTGWLRLPLERRRTCLATVAAILFITVTSVLAVSYLHSQAATRAEVTNQNLARSLVLTMEGILDAVDVATLAAGDEIARQTQSGRPERSEIGAFLGKQQRRLPVMSSLRGADASGDIGYGEGVQAPFVNIADEDYFGALRNAGANRMLVSSPSIGKFSDKWTWLFGRRIDTPSGAFAGAVYGVLELEQVQRILNTIQLDAGGSIVLRNARFEVLAGRRGAGLPFPFRVGDTRLSPELKAALRMNAHRGTYQTKRSLLSSETHTFSYERSAKYGFYVWVGESTDVVYAEWRRQAWMIGAFALSFALLSFGFLSMMGRTWLRQRRDRAVIERGRAELREAKEIAGIGRLTYDFRSASWTSSDIFNQIVGIDRNYARGTRRLLDLIGRKDRLDIQRYLRSAALRQEPYDNQELCVRRLDGQRRWVQARGKVVTEGGKAQTFVCSIQDITERKLAESQIRRLAYYDVLTEVPNRRLLLDRLAAAMAANASTGRRGALLLIDLDNFKSLNDTHGHDRGDMLLRAVARRLLAGVRSGDTVARLGGDEFLVLLEDLPADEEVAGSRVAMLGEDLRKSLAKPFDLGGYPYVSTPSVGMTLFGGLELSTDELIKRADTAMYQAKAAGRNAVRFFDPAMQAAIAAQRALEVDLQEALAASQFTLYYQPQVDAAACVRGAEVLVRWQHPLRGMVSPGEFIPLAEANGAILPLGAWVLEQACVQLARWSHHPRTQALTLAVNVSARQFSQVQFVEQVLDVLARTGANPRRLKLELTEGSLLDNTEAVIETITQLKQAGVGFSLDDFGTGYSSLNYLKRLPLDQLKIDQSFVRDLLTDPSDIAIVRTIVALGQSLGMDVLAEGVETEAQRACLASAGCHTYQGYLFGRPVPIEQFELALPA